MNVALDKIVAWLYLYKNCHYEYELWNVSNHATCALTCRKDRVQSPKRKEGWDLFWRTSDDNSRFTPINMNLKLPGWETPWWKKELQKNIRRAVDPPQEMNTTLGMRDSSRWIKLWREFQTKVRGLGHTLVVWHHWCKPFQLWKKLWSKSNSWSWGMISSIWFPDLKGSL